MGDTQINRGELEETANRVPAQGASPTTVTGKIGRVRSVLQHTVNSAEEPQRWLNQNQEWAYAELCRKLRGMSESDAREWIVELVQPEVIRERGTALQPSELRGMRVLYVEGKSASKIAGTNILRPVIHFSDVGEYQRFTTAWRGESGMSSRGMSAELKTADGPVSLLFTCGLLNTKEEKLPANSTRIGGADEYIEHEITHSIDPNLHRRTGYDQLLCEALTYYDAIIANPQAPMHEPRWGFYEQTLKDHFEKWSEDDSQNWDKKDYETVCNAVVGAIRSARSKCGDVEIQRLLAKSVRVEQFIENCK